MARSGYTVGNYLSYAGAPVTTTPLSFSCWGKTTVTGAQQRMVSLWKDGTSDYFALQVQTTGTVNARRSNAGGTITNANSAGSIAANTWFHAGAVWAGAASSAAYLNGPDKGTNGASTTPSGVNRLGVGIQNAANPFSGALAEAAIWNIALADADMLALAAGLCPLEVHPEALIAYFPVLGVNSPEPNLLSNSVILSITGSLSAADHPPTFH